MLQRLRRAACSSVDGFEMASVDFAAWLALEAGAEQRVDDNSRAFGAESASFTSLIVVLLARRWRPEISPES